MRLELLVGPIASGKSTYCRTAAQEGAIIVNDDSIVTSVHGGDYRLYQKSLKPLYKSVENCIVSTALAMGKRVIVDRPNHSISMRRRYIGIGKSFDVPVRVVMFERRDPTVHGFRRAHGDARGYDAEYWTEVAQYHEDHYQQPNPDIEHFDEWVGWCWPG